MLFCDINLSLVQFEIPLKLLIIWFEYIIKTINNLYLCRKFPGLTAILKTVYTGLVLLNTSISDHMHCLWVLFQFNVFFNLHSDQLVFKKTIFFKSKKFFLESGMVYYLPSMPAVWEVNSSNLGANFFQGNFFSKKFADIPVENGKNHSCNF